MDTNKNDIDNHYFRNLFQNLDSKKEEDDIEDEKLYKNNLYVFNEELNNNISDNILKFTHDSILNRLEIEDYSLFPPKNDFMMIENETKEDHEKLNDHEVEFLQNLNKLNYLTFSPFCESLSPSSNVKEESNEKENNQKNEQNKSKVENKEKENIIQNIINFDYNNYEINNDLLFNISMGFIDMNKLKQENKINNDEYFLHSERLSVKKKLKSKPIPQPIKPKPTEKIKEEKKEINVAFNEKRYNEILKFIKKSENKDYYKSTCQSIIKEIENLENLMTNKEKNDLLIKFEEMIKEKQKGYYLYFREMQEEKRNQRRQEKIKRKLELEKLARVKSAKKLENGLYEIKKDIDKKVKRNSLESKHGRNKKSFSQASFKNTIYSIGSSSKDKTMKKGKSLNRNETERTNWMITKPNYYYFKNL